MTWVLIETPNKTWKKWIVDHYRALTCICCFVIVIALHEQILAVLAGPLVVDDLVERADAIIVLGGERYYVAVAKLTGQFYAREILLLQGSNKLLVQTGILSPEYEKARRAIVAQGVNEDLIHVLPGETRNLWDTADILAKWLTIHPHDVIAVVVDRFESGKTRMVLQRALSLDQLARVRIVAIRDSRYDETNWWRSRVGIKSVVDSYLRIFHNRIVGRPKTMDLPRWDRKSLEQFLLTSRYETA